MTNFDELLAAQNQLMQTVSRSLPNFKKLGQAKMTLAVTRQRLCSLKETFTKCQDLDGKITLAADDKMRASHPYFLQNHFVVCEDWYNEAADFMVEVIANHESHSNAPAAANDVSLSDSFRASPRLPRINLPSFDGAFDKWENFRDRFQSMICDDNSLSNVERMHYLCSSLKGDASSALDHLAITNDNFAVAWNILLSRYDNKRRLITIHLQSLLNLPSLSSETSKDLRALRDQTNAAIQALKNLGRPIQHWDDFLVVLVAQKLDKSTRKAWEIKLGDTVDYPEYHTLDKFLESRIRSLEAIVPVSLKDKQSEQSKRKMLASHSASTVSFSCPICKANHFVYQCSTFLKQNPSQRFELIKTHKRCLNCFSAKHSAKNCPSAHSCKQCKRRHHTLLHLETKVNTSESEPASISKPANATNDGEIASHFLSKTISPKSTILLATARVRVYSATESFVIARALIDQGSASTLIAESLVQRLRLPKNKQSVLVTGIGDTKSFVHYATHITIAPVSRDKPRYSANALIFGSLTKYVPSRVNVKHTWNHVNGLELADCDPMSSDPIDLIIGADLYGMLILNGVRKSSASEPVAQNTTLGWILSGPIASCAHDDTTTVPVHHGVVVEPIDFDLRRFWEIEEIPRDTHRSAEEQQCEEHFLATHSRTPDGRYIVRLPFKSGPPIQIGDSQSIARSSFYRLENRLQTDPIKAAEYQDFLTEYEKLGHMAKITPYESVKASQAYYIPHHAVFRDSSPTTRIRVVFNASCRTTNGTSLNDHMMIGPKLQKNLAIVILNWRQFRYVYTADIAKMYRQILVNDSDTNYQRIVWRSSCNAPVEEYRLLTVTYGTAAAPYLALKVIDQLALDEGEAYPLAVPVLHHQTYVDDCVFGADDKILARQTRDQLISLLRKGGFHLRKWASNSSELLSDIEPSDHGLATSKTLQDDENIKVLGIIWNPALDSFQFRVSLPTSPGNTKRKILSTIAKFFDPLGWAAPIIISAKILMQRLWQLKCQWDDKVPNQVLDTWVKFYNQLPALNILRIPRWTTHGSHTAHSALHGFSDASTVAYAAVVYLRVVHIDGSVSVSLLIAKSKVAPLKTISVPRLELTAAHLLAQLMHFVRSSLQLSDLACYCWTDSTITLAWVAQSPAKWKTFIANRVSAIQSLLPNVAWQHVSTQTNPADCASRGLAPDDLKDHSLWWTGPPWLLSPQDCWPKSCPPVPKNVPLEERQDPSLSLHHSTPTWNLASRFSSWPKLLRVTAYLYRFLFRCRISSANSTNSRTLSLDEINKAKLYWIKIMQGDMFPSELARLNSQKSLPKSSSLVALNPYLDPDGILRVGGRLRRSRLPEAAKNPIVMRSHPLFALIIEHHHMRMLHAGSQLTLASLRSEFWILRARAVVRSVLYKCIACTRHQAKIPIELMGDLPEARVTRPPRAFSHTGVDYAGPIAVRTAPGRGHKSQKAYVALFICLATKAIHLELVNDYSSKTFIAAYQRFVSRRGLPKAMYSDNGTTFHGANRELSDAHALAIRDHNFLNKLAIDQTEWHFLPPSAPHFGGLWEAGVKSMKHHLKRCIGLQTLTFEEMTTLLCRVEACLNSRPIASVSDNLDDYQVLTPGHLLIGTFIQAVPEPSVLDIRENRLSRWQMIQRITEVFWRSWSRDYLQTLQQRPKWCVAQRLAKVGQIILVRNPVAPPSQWELGRITACHPGDDGLTRVVTVKTCRSEYQRPIAKLCFLPIPINNESNHSVTAGGIATEPPSCH